MQTDQIKLFLKSFASCPQLAKIYLFNHPEVSRAMRKTYQELVAILQVDTELVIAIVGDEIACESEIFFDLSKGLNSFITTLKVKKAEKITFLKGISYSELEAFILYFLDSERGLYDIHHYLKESHVENIRLDIIRSEKESSEELVQKNISTEEVYNDCIDRMSSSLMDILEGNEPNFANFYFIMDSLVTGLGVHYQEILKLVRVKEKDTITFAHMLNVGFLAMYFCKYIGFNKEESRDLGMAGLFHDIGKLYISNSILKGGKLTDEEFESIKSHSILGAKMLLNFTDKIGVFAPVVAMEHHLKFDGSGGYPQLKYDHPLHLSSLIVSLCDVYDALSQRRSYKRDYPPDQIYGIMKEGRGTQFSPELFDAFFEFLGVWPNGTIVVLNNHEVGIVKEQNHTSIAAPIVQILSDKSFKLVDLSEKPDWEIKQSLNPFSDGKEYLEMMDEYKARQN